MFLTKILKENKILTDRLTDRDSYSPLVDINKEKSIEKCYKAYCILGAPRMQYAFLYDV